MNRPPTPNYLRMLSSNGAVMASADVTTQGENSLTYGLRCTKFDHKEGQNPQATRLLLVLDSDDRLTTRPRCIHHDPDDDVKLIRVVDPLMACAIVQLIEADLELAEPVDIDTDTGLLLWYGVEHYATDGQPHIYCGLCVLRIPLWLRRTITDMGDVAPAGRNGAYVCEGCGRRSALAGQPPQTLDLGLTPAGDDHG